MAKGRRGSDEILSAQREPERKRGNQLPEAQESRRSDADTLRRKYKTKLKGKYEINYPEPLSP